MTQVYNAGASIVQINHFAKLPTEVIHLILGQLSMSERVPFALTCKENAATAENFKTTLAAGSKAGKKVNIKEQRVAVLIAIRDWMPRDLKLCCNCLIYRAKVLPKTLSSLGDPQASWGGNASLDWNKISAKRALQDGPRCPGCVQRENFNVQKFSKEYRKFKKTVAESCK